MVQALLCVTFEQAQPVGVAEVGRVRRLVLKVGHLAACVAASLARSDADRSPSPAPRQHGHHVHTHLRPLGGDGARREGLVQAEHGALGALPAVLD